MVSRNKKSPLHQASGAPLHAGRRSVIRHDLYRVRQKSNPLKLFAIYQTTD